MKKYLLLMLVLSLSIWTMGQSAANYTFSTSATGSLTDMSSGTTTLLSGASLDDVASTVNNIGFTFYVMGKSFTQFSVNSNGSMGFGSTAVGTSGTALGTATNPVIAPFGGDQAVLTTGGKVHYKVIGTAPNRTLVIEWLNMKINYSGYATATTGDGTYQVRLSETPGTVEFCYGNMAVATTFTTGPVIGISAGSGTGMTVGVTSSTNTATVGTAWINNTYVVGAIANLNSTSDGSRRVYTFTPSASSPDAPITMTFTGLSTSGMTVNWVDNSTNESFFNVTRALDAGFTTGVVTSTVASTTTATTGTVISAPAITGLVPGTTYYFKVSAGNEGMPPSSDLSGSQATNSPGLVTSTTTGGNWGDVGTWVGGVLPGQYDNVLIADGATVTINTTTAICWNLTVGQGTSGILNFLAGTASTLTVGNTVTVAANGNFNAGTGTLTTHNLYIGGSTASGVGTGSLVNNGTFDMSGTANVTVTFYGVPDASISGTGATLDFYRVVLNKGSVTATSTVTPPILEIQVPFTVQGANTAGPIYTHTAGVLKIGGTFTLNAPLYSAAGYTVPSSGGLWLNNANFTAAGQNGSPTISGLLKISAGTYNVGTATGNSIGLNSGSIVRVEGGTTNIAGRLAVASSSNTVYYNQSGGILNVQTIGHSSTTYYGFDLGTSSSTNMIMSAGAINVVKGSGYDYRGSTAGTINITGGTLQFGTSGSGATAITYKIMGNAPSTVLDASSANHNITLAGDFKVNGDLTINGTGTFSLGTLYYLYMNGMNATYPGNIVNNGTMTLNGGSSQQLIFNSSFGSQSLTGGTITGNTITRLLVNNTFAGGTVTLPSGLTIKDPGTGSGYLNLQNGILSASSLTLGGGAATGFTFIKGNGSLASAPTYAFGTGTVAYTYNGTTAQVTGSELPASISGTLTINNATGVTLNAPLSAAGLTLTAGKLTTSATNLLTITGTTAGAISGYTSTAYVVGPIARTLAASQATGSTFVFPVGKSAYKPLEFVNPITAAGSPMVVQAEVFDADCGGTNGVNLSAINHDRYWSAAFTSGGSNFTSTTVRLTEAGLTSQNGMGKSATVAGSYDLISSATPTATTVISDAITSLGYFVVGTKSVPMTYTSSNVTQASTSTLLQNSTNQAIIGIQVVTTGNASPLAITKFTVSGNGTTAAGDISNAKIWSTGTSSTFAATTQFGSTVAAPTLTSFDITGSSTLVEGTNYFWLTFDIPLTATSTHLVDAECTVVTVGGVDKTPTTTAPTGSRTITLVAPTAFTATVIGPTEIDLTWTKNATNQDVIVATASTSTFGVPANGTAYVAGNSLPTAGTVIYVGPLSAFNHTGLTSATAYYYKAWSVDASNYYSATGVTANGNTQCDAISTFPYNDGFETGYIDQTIFGNCWSQVVTGSYSWTANSTLTTYNRTPHTGTWDAYLHYSGDAWMFKKFHFTAATSYDVSLWARQDMTTTTDAGIEIKYGTTATSAGMTNTIVANTGLNSTYAQLAGSFTPATTGDYFIGIHGVMNSTPYYISLDDIKVDLTPNCIVPTALTTSGITTNSATIGWTASVSAPANGYDIYYSTSATAPVAGTTPTGTVGAGVTSFGTGGVLTAATTYYAWVRSNCGGALLSDWAGPVNFTTLCNNATIPTTVESFEGTAIPVCWTTGLVSGSTNWAPAASNDGVSAPHTGSKFLGKAYTASDALAFSQPINMTSSASGGRINVWVYRSGSGVATDLIKFHVNTTQSITGATQLLSLSALYTGAPAVASAGWYNYIVDIPSSYNSNTTVYIIAEGYTNSGYSSYGLGIDDFMVEAIPVVPTFTITPTSKDFGQAVAAGTPSDAQTFTISNTGASVLTINAANISLTGTDASQFVLTDANIYPISLTTGQTATVTVKFAPTTAGAKSANLQIVHNAAGSPAIVPLTGTALPAGSLYEDFEGATFPPAGWAAASWSASSSTRFHGVKSAYYYYYGSFTDAKLITPMVTIGSGNTLTFAARGYSGSEVLQVAYSTDKTTWTNVGSSITLSSSTFAQYSVDLSAVPAGNYYLAFVGSSTYTYTNYVYVDYVAGPVITPLLPDPAVIGAPANAATSIALNTTLTWTPASTGGIPTGFKLYFGTDGAGTVRPTNIENGTLQTSPYTPINVLSYSTTYYWQVVPTNAVGDALTCPIWSFTTMADPTLTPPVTENFAGATFPPTNWLRYSGLLADPSVLTVYSGGWIQDDYANVTSPVNKAARVNVYGSTCKYWLTTPPIDLGSTITDYQLEFDVALTAYSSTGDPGTSGTDDKFAVVISTDGGSSWTAAKTMRLWDNAGSSYVYNSLTPAGEHVILPLSAYSGKVMFAFYGESTTSNADNDLFVDNVVIQRLPTCFNPSNIVSSSVLSTTATISWDAASPAPANGYEYEIRTSGAAGSGATGLAVSGTTLAGVTTANVVGLAPSTVYYTYVRSSCGSGSYGLWIASATTFKTLCTGLPITTYPFSENFNDGVVPPCGWSEIVNNTAANWQYDASTPYFAEVLHDDALAAQDEWLVTPTLDFTTMVSPQITFKWMTSYYWSISPNNNYDVNLKISSDGGTTWTKLWSEADAGSFTSWTWYTKTIPLNVYGGMSNVKIAWQYVGANGAQFGVDDVVIDLGPACPAPINLKATAINSTSATIGWTPQGAESSWEYVYGVSPLAAPTGSGTSTSSPSVPLTLANNTTYQFYVRAMCTGSQSTWSGPYTFKTLCPTSTAPFTEDFSLTTFPPSCWNMSTTPAWIRSSSSGYSVGTGSAEANFYNISSSTPFDLATFPFDASGMTTPTLDFDWAYTGYYDDYYYEYIYDDVKIFTSTDLGATYTLLLDMPGESMMTATETGSGFTPTSTQWASKSIVLPTGTNMIKFTGYSSYGNNFYLDNVKVWSPAPPTKTLNMKVLLSGLMAPRDMVAPPTGTMYEAIDGNLGTPQFGTGKADAVTVQLYDATPALVTEFTGVVLNLDGTTSLTIPNTYSGNYYVRVVPRTHIPVWSATPISFAGSTITYNFSDNWTKAYQFEGNDLEPEKMMSTGVYALYLGDQDHNTYIDIDDMNTLLPDVTNGTVGYVESDIDGYGWVDIDDMNLLLESVTYGYYEQSPALGKGFWHRHK